MMVEINCSHWWKNLTSSKTDLYSAVVGNYCSCSSLAFILQGNPLIVSGVNDGGDQLIKPVEKLDLKYDGSLFCHGWQLL
jgi:hypothetical protein